MEYSIYTLYRQYVEKVKKRRRKILGGTENIRRRWKAVDFFTKAWYAKKKYSPVQRRKGGVSVNLTELLAAYQALVPVEKRELLAPAWSGCISLDYWPGGSAPRGIMFMQQVATAQQDERYNLYRTPASLYIRVHYDSAEVPQKLLGKEQCEVFELYGPIHEQAEKHGYEPISPVSVEFEYYSSLSCFAYCAVKRKAE